jgi:hypothetical protein
MSEFDRRPWFDLNDLHTQSGGLHHLLHMLYEASTELDYGSAQPGAAAAANRVNSLIILARDEAERLDANIGRCIEGGGRDFRTPAESGAFSNSGHRDATEVSDFLARAIDRHEAAYAYFNSTCFLEDSGALGREPTADEQAIANAASEIEDEALTVVSYFPARTAADLAAKARHLRKYHHYRYGHLEDHQVENLLRSMLPEAEREALDASMDGEGGDA